MTDTKTCTYQSCKNTFDRPVGIADGTWKQLSRCPACRKKAHQQRKKDCLQPESHLGRYEVKNEIIDRFLYSKCCAVPV